MFLLKLALSSEEQKKMFREHLKENPIPKKLLTYFSSDSYLKLQTSLYLKWCKKHYTQLLIQDW